MQINEIFDLSKNDEAYKFVRENKGTTIKDLGGGRYQIVELPKQSLDELKLAKRAEINAARDAAEQGGFEYLGKTFDSDQISAQRISMAAQAMALAPEESSIVWTCTPTHATKKQRLLRQRLKKPKLKKNLIKQLGNNNL